MLGIGFIILFGCVNKNSKQESIDKIKVKKNSISKKEITCDLIKNEKRLLEIIDSLQIIYGKSAYSCRCSSDYKDSKEINKIGVQILKSTDIREIGLIWFKYDTVKHVFSSYDMNQGLK